MNVLLSIPTTGWVHKTTAATLVRLLQHPCGHRVHAIQPTHVPFENNLHHIARQVLRDGYDYWLSFDADNPPRRNPLELIDFDLDVVGCPTPVWHYTGNGERPIYWNVYRYNAPKDGYNEYPDKTGLQSVDAIGTGCFVVARRVLEHPRMQGGAFTRPLHADGRVERGNDIAFCERARRSGFSVWAHYDYLCSHFQELDLCEVIEAYANG